MDKEEPNRETGIYHQDDKHEAAGTLSALWSDGKYGRGEEVCEPNQVDIIQMVKPKEPEAKLYHRDIFLWCATDISHIRTAEKGKSVL